MDRILEQLKESWKMMEFEENTAPGLSALVSDVEDLQTKDELEGMDLSEEDSISNIQKINIKDFKSALRSHNAGIKYDVSNPASRIVRTIAIASHGDVNGKVNMKNASDWARSTLPPGAGYPNQDARPEYTDVINYLKGLNEASLDDANVQDVNLDDIIKTKTDNPDIAKGIKFNREHPAAAYKKDKNILNPKTGKPYLSAERPQRLIHSSALLKVLTPDGTEIDQEKLRKMISVKPQQIIAQNSKLAASGATTNEIFYDLTLPAYQGLFYNEKEGKFQIVKTCPSAGACKAYCYATRGSYLQYEGPWLSQARMINYLMNDYTSFKQQVINELAVAEKRANKKGTKVVLRWHDSGDMISPTYLQMAYDVARQTPNIRHYAYTKQVDLVNKMADKKPDNFILNYSKGGTSDKKVDFTTEKHSKVIPYVLFKDLKVEKGVPMTPNDISTLKDRLIKTYNMDPGKLLTYDELMKTPVGTSGGGFNVIVRPGDGDDAASREDVLGTLLLIH